MAPEEFDIFAKKLLAFPWPSSDFPGEPMHLPHAVLFTCRTSVHPSVLTHPSGYELRVALGRVVAHRPKWTGNEYCPPLSNLIRPFASDFIADLRSRPDHCYRPFKCGPGSIVPLDRKVSRLMPLVGHPGRTWRAFRHQAIYWFFEIGMDVPTVKRV
ncbi:MAG: hypothetical protein ACREEC_02590, partial [Thermoplasmata archaeon]